MVSHSSHTNHEFLILVIRVANVSFAIGNFVTYEKVLMLHMKIIFLLLKAFYSLIWRTYYKLRYEKFSKKQIGKMWLKTSKTPIKDKTPLKLQAWHITFKTSLYCWSRNKWLLFYSSIPPLMFDLCLCLKI